MQVNIDVGETGGGGGGGRKNEHELLKKYWPLSCQVRRRTYSKFQWLLVCAKSACPCVFACAAQVSKAHLEDHLRDANRSVAVGDQRRSLMLIFCRVEQLRHAPFAILLTPASPSVPMKLNQKQ